MQAKAIPNKARAPEKKQQPIPQPQAQPKQTPVLPKVEQVGIPALEKMTTPQAKRKSKQSQPSQIPVQQNVTQAPTKTKSPPLPQAGTQPYGLAPFPPEAGRSPAVNTVNARPKPSKPENTAKKRSPPPGFATIASKKSPPSHAPKPSQTPTNAKKHVNAAPVAAKPPWSRAAASRASATQRPQDNNSAVAGPPPSSKPPAEKPKTPWAKMAQKRGTPQKMPSKSSKRTPPQQARNRVFPQTPRRDQKSDHWWQILFFPTTVRFKKFQAKIVGKGGELHRQHMKEFRCTISIKDPQDGLDQVPNPDYKWSGHPSVSSVIISAQDEKTTTRAVDHVAKIINGIMKDHRQKELSILELVNCPPIQSRSPQSRRDSQRVHQTTPGGTPGPPGLQYPQQPTQQRPSQPQPKPQQQSGGPSPSEQPKRKSSGYSNMASRVRRMEADQHAARINERRAAHSRMIKHATSLRVIPIPKRRRWSEKDKSCKWCYLPNCDEVECWFNPDYHKYDGDQGKPGKGFPNGIDPV